MQTPLQIFSQNNSAAQAKDNSTSDNEMNLFHYASEAADTMGFDYGEELHAAVKRAMELCSATGQPLHLNFKRVFKSSPSGILYDWKLSVLAYQLVRINGETTNPKVAELQMQLLKNFFPDQT